MDAGQVFVLVLALAVFLAFTIELWGSIGDYREHTLRPERRRGAPRLRDVLKSLVLWIGVLSILLGRLVATLVADPDVRRDFGLFSGSLVSGALIIGGLALAWSRLSERGEA